MLNNVCPHSDLQYKALDQITLSYSDVIKVFIVDDAVVKPSISTDRQPPVNRCPNFLLCFGLIDSLSN